MGELQKLSEEDRQKQILELLAEGSMDHVLAYLEESDTFITTDQIIQGLRQSAQQKLDRTKELQGANIKIFRKSAEKDTARAEQLEKKEITLPELIRLTKEKYYSHLEVKK